MACFVIAYRNTPVMVALPMEDFEILMATLDVLGDPVVMGALNLAQSGKGACRKLNLDVLTSEAVMP